MSDTDSSWSEPDPLKEEWPDPDADPTTEEGAEIIRRHDAMFAARNRAQREIDRGPSVAYEIPPALYDKAEAQQDQLTEAERELLLSRGDVYGKALARPESLTEAERYTVMGWPAPEVARGNVRQVTGGELSEPRELFAKARASIQSQQNLSSLSPDEVMLIVGGYRTKDDISLPRFTQVPGNRQAANLAREQEGIDIETLTEVSKRAAALLTSQSLRGVGPTRAPANTLPGSAASFQPFSSASSSAHLHFNAAPVSSSAPLPLAHETGFAPSFYSSFQPPTAPAPGIGPFAASGQGFALSQPSQPNLPFAHGINPQFNQQPQSSFFYQQPAFGSELPQVQPLPPGIVSLGPPFTGPFSSGPGFSQEDPAGIRGRMPPLRNINRNMSSTSWPPGLPSKDIMRPLKLFDNDLKVQLHVDSLVEVFDDYALEINTRWQNLAPEERAAYEARSEALRQQAWATFQGL